MASGDSNEYSDFDVVREPEVPRRLSIWPHQWVGIPLLLAIPVLAITGALGDRVETISVPAERARLETSYPGTLRHGQPEELRIGIQNVSQEVLPEVVVEVDRKYLANFSDVRVSPPLQSDAEVHVSNLQPGERRELKVELRANRYGSHEGHVRLFENGKLLADAGFKSLVLP